jgi:hypothetical protein
MKLASPLYRSLVFILIVLFAVSCHSNTHVPGTFGYDLQFLKEHDSVIVLQSGESKVIVSPK